MKFNKRMVVITLLALMVVCPFMASISFAVSSASAESSDGASQIQVDVGVTLGSSQKISNFLGIQGMPYTFSPSNPDQEGIRMWRELGLNISEIGLFSDGGGISVMRNVQGKLELDFTEFEALLDYITKTLGVKQINFQIGLMPKALSSKPDDDYFGFYSPTNYQEWEDIVYRAISHLKNKLGFAGAHYQVWSEPEGYHQFRGRPERKDNDVKILDDYVELYIKSCKAAKRADPTAKVGGPMSSIYSSELSRSCGHSWGLDDFIKKLASYNRQRPTNNVALDEVVWQDYDWFNDGRIAMGVRHIQSVLKANGFPVNTPQYLVGWNTDYAENLHPGSKTLSQHAVYIAAMIIEQLNLGDQGLNRAYLWPFDYDYQFKNSAIVTIPYPEQVMGGDPGTFDGEFFGKRQTFPAVTQHCKRPAYAGLQMISAMKEGQFIKITENDLPKGVQIMATRNNDGIILISANNTATARSITIHFSHLPYGTETVTSHLKRVDQDHSMDCQGLEAGSKTSVEVKDGKLTIPLEMSPYSIAQISLGR